MVQYKVVARFGDYSRIPAMCIEKVVSSDPPFSTRTITQFMIGCCLDQEQSIPTIQLDRVKTGTYRDKSWKKHNSGTRSNRSLNC